MRRTSLFGIGALGAASGLGAIGAQDDIIPERRARGYSDQPPDLGNSLLMF